MQLSCSIRSGGGSARRRARACLLYTSTGLTNLVYLLMDEPERMARLLALMERQHDIAAALAADSPAECVMIPPVQSAPGLHNSIAD